MFHTQLPCPFLRTCCVSLPTPLATWRSPKLTSSDLAGGALAAADDDDEVVVEKVASGAIALCAALKTCGDGRYTRSDECRRGAARLEVLAEAEANALVVDILRGKRCGSSGGGIEVYIAIAPLPEPGSKESVISGIDSCGWVLVGCVENWKHLDTLPYLSLDTSSRAVSRRPEFESANVRRPAPRTNCKMAARVRREPKFSQARERRSGWECGGGCSRQSSSHVETQSSPIGALRAAGSSQPLRQKISEMWSRRPTRRGPARRLGLPHLATCRREQTSSQAVVRALATAGIHGQSELQSRLVLASIEIMAGCWRDFRQIERLGEIHTSGCASEY